MSLPSNVMINAYTGAGLASATGELTEQGARRWSLLTQTVELPNFLKVPEQPNPLKWRDPGTGWGMILPHRPQCTRGQLADLADAPEAVRELWLKRDKAPVFRFDPSSADRFRKLCEPARGVPVDITGAAPPGIAPGHLPSYLLIVGDPAEVPWELQYQLNPICAVGRLALHGDALKNYITALLSDWNESDTAARNVLLWSVDQAFTMTGLMRKLIADPLFADMNADRDITTLMLSGPGKATAGKLAESVKAHRPSFIVTTSHGNTPLHTPEKLRATLGVLVDQDWALASAESLLESRMPDGAIWYAHACCSAGSNSADYYSGLLAKGEALDVVNEVGALGPTVAPFPTALLGASKPIRAFVGHVEPTFDFAIRQPATGQPSTYAFRQAFYVNLFRDQPLGAAMKPIYDRIKGLQGAYDNSLLAYKQRGPDADAQIEIMTQSRLAERDLKSIVILGDPTVTLPKTTAS